MVEVVDEEEHSDNNNRIGGVSIIEQLRARAYSGTREEIGFGLVAS